MKRFLFILFFLFGSTFKSSSQSNDTIQPEFPGGLNALLEYISKNVSHPESSRLLYSGGKFLATFIVNSDSKISDVVVTPGNDTAIVNSIRKTFLSMPEWKPGLINNQPVALKFISPINLKLSTVKEKKQQVLTYDFVDFRYHKSAKIICKENVVRVNGKAAAGDIVIQNEKEDFNIKTRLEEFPKKIPSENSSIEIVRNENVILNGYPAEVIVGRFRFGTIISSLVGDMELKCYKIKVDDAIYSVTTIDFRDDLKKNFNRNALVMSSLKFK